MGQLPEWHKATRRETVKRRLTASGYSIGGPAAQLELEAHLPVQIYRGFDLVGWAPTAKIGDELLGELDRMTLEDAREFLRGFNDEFEDGGRLNLD